jgi:integrase
VAKSYRLLKAIMNTAVDDGIIRRNPCRVRGASQDRSPERPVLALREVVDLAEAIGERYQALILVAVFGSLRWGELAALRRRDIDQDASVAKVERSLTERPGGGYYFGPPKPAAGQRTIAVPAVIMATLKHHLETFTGPEPDALVFTSPTGAPLRHNNFRRRHWLPALAAADLSGIPFHDLRHTGNALTAGTGATLRELMDRMGHSSARAALIYLHGSDVRQREIAKSLSKVAQRELRAARSGTQHADLRAVDEADEKSGANDR